MLMLGKRQIAVLRLIASQRTSPVGGWLDRFYHKVAERLVDRGLLSVASWDYTTKRAGMCGDRIRSIPSRWKITEEGRAALAEREPWRS